MNRPKITKLPLKELHALRTSGVVSDSQLRLEAQAGADCFPGHPMYACRVTREGEESATSNPRMLGPLASLPVSVKDLFDVAGVPTTCGSPFFAKTRSLPEEDSGYVARWRSKGVCFTGKTHLNEFAYGITGENRWFGDCWIPDFPDRLTGGSSSGAAATVAAGAACLALGSDTGGSLRVPAAMCGLVSVRQSLGFGEMEGAFPLAQAFDTVGWIQRHLSDVSWVAHALHPEVSRDPQLQEPRIGWVKGSFLDGITDEVIAAADEFESVLRDGGARSQSVEAPGWEEAVRMFVPIQANDAARNHAPYLAAHRDQYDPAILERLALGASVTLEQRRDLDEQRERFCRDWIQALFEGRDFLVVPSAPVVRLKRGEDHRNTRPRLLRFTAPASLGGLPVLTVPWIRSGVPCGGFQILAPRGADARLWAFADWLAQRLA